MYLRVENQRLKLPYNMLRSMFDESSVGVTVRSIMYMHRLACANNAKSVTATITAAATTATTVTDRTAVVRSILVGVGDWEFGTHSDPKSRFGKRCTCKDNI